MAAIPVSSIPSPELKLATQRVPGRADVRCMGRITSDTSSLLQNTIRNLIPETKRIVVDLNDVSCLDSSGLGALVGLFLSSKKAGCELTLINLEPATEELLRTTGLVSLFEGHRELLGLAPDY